MPLEKRLTRERRHRSSWCLGLLLGICLCPWVRASDLDLSAYRGKVVYVDFWASWCGPCRESFPWLDELVREYQSKDFVVIGVNVDKDRDRAERFLSENPADFPIVYDPRGDLASAYKVAGMPSAILIDRAGHIRFQHAGFSAKQKGLYEQQLQTLLAETIH
jgi:cytochrome c biogenesis protein CcmG/thiol:disulfide interchange protein DsbE